jgi:tellurite resistance protein
MLSSERIRFFPITLFAVVMGLAGLAIAYEKAHHLLGLPYFPFVTLLGISAILFVNHIIVYGIKAVRFPEEVKAEFFHPIRMNFFPAVSISILLLSVGAYSFAPIVAVTLWFIGTALHTLLTLYIFSYWIRNNFEITHSNPAWFIPIVGNVIIPIIGVDILGSEPMVFYFAVGIFFWLVLFTVVLYRIIFHHQLAVKFLPTLFILIAPPAVGFVSYLRITANYDLFALFLLDIGFFFTLLLFFMGRSFLRIKYFVSWWAFTFPLDAITIASTVAYQVTGYTFYRYTSYALLAIATTVIAVVAYQTLRHGRQREICIQE